MARAVTPKDPVPTAEEELARLRAENAELRLALESVPVPSEKPQRGSTWRGVLGFILIFFGVILAPVAATATWTAAQITDTDQFVESLAPIVNDPDVQVYISDQIVSAIESSVDIDGLTADVFSGIAGLENIPPAAGQALVLLQPAAADGLKALISDQVTKLVQSDAFATIWAESLRLSHEQLNAVLSNDTSNAVVVSDTGEVGIQLKPLVDKVKERLVESNFPLAEKIPEIDKTIVVAQIDNITSIRAAYNTLITLAAVLPWISIALLIAGILLSRNRARATMGAGIGVAVSGFVLWAGLLVGRAVIVLSITSAGVPGGVARTIYNTLTTALQSAAVGLLILGLAIAIVGFFTGGSRQAQASRSGVSRLVGSIRDGMDRIGFSSEGLGAWLYRARVFIWAAVIIIAVLVLLASRPITPGAVLLTTLIALLVLFIVALFERPPKAELIVAAPE